MSTPETSSSEHENSQPSLVGIVPAAGRATRLALASGSKEVQLIATGGSRASATPVGRLLLEQWRLAGCARVCIVIRPGKWDIIECFADDAQIGLPVCYVTTSDSLGPPFTVAAAFAHTAGCTIITGFPDILLEPPTVAKQLLERLYSGTADVALATLPCLPDGSADRVDVDLCGRVTQLVPKEQHPEWGSDPRAWMMVAWRPAFTDFFAATLAQFRAGIPSTPEQAAPEWPMGSVLVAALQAGITIDTVHFPQGRWLDIGTPDRLAEAAGFFTKNT